MAYTATNMQLGAPSNGLIHLSSVLTSIFNYFMIVGLCDKPEYFGEDRDFFLVF
jgi:hypothetical protein